MSEKQFEDFLVEQLLADLSGLEFRPGNKYKFKSPDFENSLELYGALLKCSTDEVVIDEDVHLPVIEFGKGKLISVLHSEPSSTEPSSFEPLVAKGFTENYISRLRDGVSGQISAIDGFALLIIHNSQLDTLMNSAEDLAADTKCWSPESIQTSLTALINEAHFAEDVSKCLLEYQFSVIKDDGSTIFGFEPLFNALLVDGDLKFNELDLLDDPIVVSMEKNPKQISKRLDENRELYQHLFFETEHFYEQRHDRLKIFSDKFIDKHFSSPVSWKSVDYETFRKEIEKNRVQQLQLLSEEVTGGYIIARPKSDTKAGLRERHIIILLSEQINKFDLKLSFQNGNIEKSQFTVKHSDLNSAPEVNVRNGLKSYATISALYDEIPAYFTITLNRDNSSETFIFRCLVMRQGDFYIDAFKSAFQINPQKKLITLQTEDNQLQIRADSAHNFELTDTGQTIDVSEFGLIDYESLANESDDLDFVIKSGNNSLTFSIEGAVATSSLALPLLLNRDRIIKLFDDRYFGEYLASKDKVSIDNSEYSVLGVRLQLLREENYFLKNRIISRSGTEEVTLSALNSVNTKLASAYEALYDYLENNKTLISLVSWGSEFLRVIEDILSCYENALEQIPLDSTLNLAQKDLLKIGLTTIQREDISEEYLSPYHPLVLSYFYNLANEMRKDSKNSFSYLPQVTLNRMTPRGLLPFVYNPNNDYSYSSQVKENAFWLKLVPQQDTSYDFVRKLVKEKINEFILAYEQLFKSETHSKLLLSGVNLSNCDEFFLGVLDYFVDRLESAYPVHVYLYDNAIEYSAFDRFSETASYDELKTWLGLHKGRAKEHADLVIDLLRTRLTFSKFIHSQVEGAQPYSHVSFFRNVEKVDLAYVTIDKFLSGVSCDGLISGEASFGDSKTGSYYTGFGLHKIDYEKYPHLRLANKIGSLQVPALKANTPYTGSNALSLAISETFTVLLDRSYDNSIWTTIIDPKVTLQFFHEQQDVVLIHYSDQYTNSSNYDAITVTKQVDLYQKLMNKDGGGHISEFNAFNGDWLLKMLTSNDTIRKERKGVIGAYKFIFGLLKDSDITWVPLSVGEMLRVSGNIGLKMTDSDFSRNVQGYKSGAISDDVLFVGFKDEQLYLLPLEVKTGATPDYLKAIEQTKELLRYLSNEILGPGTLASKLYRGLFVRQVLMQIDKYELYDVFEPDYFEPVKDRREWWLQGNYEIGLLHNYPQGFVLAHLDSADISGASYNMNDGVLITKLPMSLLNMLVSTPLQKLINDDLTTTFHVPEQYLLGQSSTKVNVEFTESSEGEVEVPEGDGVESASIETTELQEMPVAQSVANLKVMFGQNDITHEPLVWEPTNTSKFMNTNTGIIGTMGTGKTQFTKSVVTQLHRNGHENVDSKSIGLLIFDYKSDYVDDEFVTATKGKKYNLHRLPYNPLSLFGNTPMLPVHTARGFSETMGKAFGLGQKQQLKLRKLIADAYELAGIIKSDSSTWSKPAPTIADVWALFEESEPAEDSLYAALESLHELEVFESDQAKCKSLYELIDGITVIELAAYPGEIQSLVVALTLDLFYSQMQKQGKPQVKGDFRQITKMILVDEADNFMSQNFPSLRKILKEGREYGVGVLLSTQDITHFQTGDNDYSSYILTWVIHRVAKLKNQDIKAIFNASDKTEQENLMSTIGTLDKHHSLYIDGEKKIHRMKDKAFWQLLET